MSERTQFWLGSVLLALAVGLLAGGLVFPRAIWGQDEPTAVVPGGRYSVLTGIRGSTQHSQTLYLLDDVEDLLLAYEYDSRARQLEPHLKGSANLRRYTARILEERAKVERNRRPR
jgi:hypothetical protein